MWVDGGVTDSRLDRGGVTVMALEEIRPLTPPHRRDRNETERRQDMDKMKAEAICQVNRMVTHSLVTLLPVSGPIRKPPWISHVPCRLNVLLYILF